MRSCPTASSICGNQRGVFLNAVLLSGLLRQNAPPFDVFPEPSVLYGATPGFG
jgi:hypothetical protein